MTTTQIRVCSTSFVLPGSPAWRPLTAFGQVDFGDYGDWPQVMLAGDPRPVVWMLFLDDVVPAENAGEDALAVVLDALATRLQTVSAPTLVAWSAWRPGSVIAEARAPSPWRRMTRRFEDALYQLAAQFPALHVVALDDVLAGMGLSQAFDARNFYAARCRLSRQGLAAAIGAIAQVVERQHRAPRKVLVLDCDNTLWGGVIGEVGLGGVALGGDGTGKAFADVQRVAKRWSQSGVLLALASKNNEAEVWEVFDRHPGMVLSRADIAAFRIDWREKPANVAEMAEELGLGLDSVVFWDDNPLEREKMRAAHPQVAVPELSPDVTPWPALLEGLDLLARFAVTDEDRRKTEQYRSRAAFMSERRDGGNEAAFLRSIALRPGMQPLAEQTLARAEQLCAKTNQFNLRTVRHSAAELAALAAECGDMAFLATLSDRFGDHGMVGLAIARPLGDVAVLDSFMLSCRVLGRRLESWMLAQSAQAARRRGCRWLAAQFVPSERNAVAAAFLQENGLCPADDRHPALPAARTALGGGGPIHIADLTQFSPPFLDVFPPC